jgi:hypothetical protein
MSADVKVRVTEDAENKKLTMEVFLEQETGTELEKLIVGRLKPMMEMYLDQFEAINSQPKEEPSRIITL